MSTRTYPEAPITSIKAGDAFIDVYGRTLVATGIREYDDGIYIWVEGQNYPEFYISERRAAIIARNDGGWCRECGGRFKGARGLLRHRQARVHFSDRHPNFTTTKEN